MMKIGISLVGMSGVVEGIKKEQGGVEYLQNQWVWFFQFDLIQIFQYE